jgi:hypothetical protein
MIGVFEPTPMSASPSTTTKKMQLTKPVAKFVKRIRRQWLNWHVNGLDHIIPPTTTASSFLAASFSPTPLTLPVSPRSGHSSVTLSQSPPLQAKEMERTDSEGGALSTESGLTTLSAGSSESQPVTTGLKDLPPTVKEESESEEASIELRTSKSPPPEHVELEVSDPFLVDDDAEDSMSDEDLGGNAVEAPADEVSPAQPPSPTTPVTPLTPNVNKAVPPPPDSDEDSDEAPDLYLPGLIIPTMFLPIPNVRRLSLSYHLMWWFSSKRISMYNNNPSARLIR